jgi:hypothetical protein
MKLQSAKTWILHAWSIFFKEAHLTKLWSKKIFSIKTLYVCFFHLQNFVHPEVAEFIPLIMNTISLQPPQHLRQSPAFNKEVFVDFMGAQIKTLSFLAYIIR